MSNIDTELNKKLFTDKNGNEMSAELSKNLFSLASIKKQELKKQYWEFKGNDAYNPNLAVANGNSTPRVNDDFKKCNIEGMFKYFIEKCKDKISAESGEQLMERYSHIKNIDDFDSYNEIQKLSVIMVVINKMVHMYVDLRDLQLFSFDNNINTIIRNLYTYKADLNKLLLFKCLQERKASENIPFIKIVGTGNNYIVNYAVEGMNLFSVHTPSETIKEVDNEILAQLHLDLSKNIGNYNPRVEEKFVYNGTVKDYASVEDVFGYEIDDKMIDSREFEGMGIPVIVEDIDDDEVKLIGKKALIAMMVSRISDKKNNVIVRGNEHKFDVSDYIKGYYDGPSILPKIQLLRKYGIVPGRAAGEDKRKENLQVSLTEILKATNFGKSKGFEYSKEAGQILEVPRKPLESSSDTVKETYEKEVEKFNLNFEKIISSIYIYTGLEEKYNFTGLKYQIKCDDFSDVIENSSLRKNLKSTMNIAKENDMFVKMINYKAAMLDKILVNRTINGDISDIDPNMIPEIKRILMYKRFFLANGPVEARKMEIYNNYKKYVEEIHGIELDKLDLNVPTKTNLRNKDYEKLDD